MKYRYTIIGRIPGNVNHTTYEGTFEAVQQSTDHALVQSAFDQEFGDHDYTEAIKEAAIQHQTLAIESSPVWINACVDTGEFTFDVEIVEVVEGATPFPDSYEAFRDNHAPLLAWCVESFREEYDESTIDAKLTEICECGVRWRYCSSDASDVVNDLIEILNDGCKSWTTMSRAQLIEEVWYQCGAQYATGPSPTWEGFLARLENNEE